MASTDLEGQPSKKGRTRKRDDEPLPPKPTYNAAVAGSSSVVTPTPVQPWMEEEPVLVEEGDLTSEEGESGPCLWLSQTFKQCLDQQWEQTVIIKLMGRRIGYRTLCTLLQSLWQLRGLMKVVDLDHDFYLVKLKEEANYLRVLTNGPWMLFSQVLAVQRWFPTFRLSQAQVTHAVVWVRFPNLPIARYHPTILQALGNLVRSLVKVDAATTNAQRGRFARLAVELDLSAPLRTSLVLDGETIMVEYEGLPTVCSSCGFIGHESAACPHRPSTTDVASKKHKEAAIGSSRASPLGRNDAGTTPGPSSGEQPWIPSRGGRRGQRPARAAGTPSSSSSAIPGHVSRTVHQRVGQRGAAVHRGGSRFNILETIVSPTEDLSSPSLPSHPFIFFGSGRRVEQTSLVLNEPNETHAGPILTEGSPQFPVQAQSASSAEGPTGLLSVGPATGSGPHPGDPTLVQLQPSPTAQHLAIDLQSHIEMVCDQVLLIGQVPGGLGASPLNEGVEASGLAVGAGHEVPIPTPQLDEPMVQVQQAVNIPTVPEGAPRGASA
ncbi:hypothetical protein K2173_019600 [Erythroxylum novogranatense]|uniref:DUF4283 domain-containing protein n=1 Tax=Erythroxylum novogranatense TaxID=1862640 RepID=A0AAV8UF20_9ROSI|nr:hypothetical protein K2173_019600 [Erythroxylum novogranatense]